MWFSCGGAPCRKATIICAFFQMEKEKRRQYGLHPTLPLDKLSRFRWFPLHRFTPSYPG
jgi:hypothetical protein